METYKKHLDVSGIRHRAKNLIPIEPTHAREVIAWMVGELDRFEAECDDLEAKFNIRVLLEIIDCPQRFESMLNCFWSYVHKLGKVPVLWVPD